MTGKNQALLKKGAAAGRRMRRLASVSVVFAMIVGTLFFSEAEQVNAAADVTVNMNSVIVPDYVGHGTQYNQNLYAAISAADGITSGNVGNLEAKVKALSSQHVRIFLDPEALDAVNYPDYMPSFIQTVELAQASGSTVNITWWHGPYNNVEQQMQAFADVLYDLIVTRGLTAVKYITIQNEVNSTSISQSLYESLYRALDEDLTNYGIRDDVQFIGGDLVRTNQQSWFQYMDANMYDVLDGYSIHIYWDYDDRSYAETRLSEVYSIANGLTHPKPVFITEFGVRGDRSVCTQAPGCLNGTTIPLETTTISAFQQAWFIIKSMRWHYAATVKWDAYKANYDNGNQYFSEIGSGTDGYPLKPSYHMSRMFTNTSKPGWQVLTVDGYVGKWVTALKDPASNDMAVYALNDTGGQTTISIDGLPANKKFRLLIWNDDGLGGIKDVGDVTTNGSGEIAVRLNAESFAALTTLDPGDAERIAYYPADESGGTTATDITDYEHDAVLYNGAAWTSGKIGGALDLDGVNDYAETPYILNPAKAYSGFTAAAWVKLEQASGTVQVILQQKGGVGRMWLYRSQEGYLGTYIGGVATESTVTMPVGQWQHVAVTYDGTTVRLILNGQLAADKNVAAEMSVDGMVIGANKSYGNLWNGQIDDLMIFPRKLTVQDVKDIWNAAHWKFDETSGTTANDSSGFNHAGTVYGAVWTADGKMNGALDFDGIDDYVQTPPVLDPSGQYFSATAWVKLEQASGTVQLILQQDGTNGRHWLYRSASGKLGTYLKGSALESAGTIPVGTWTFAAVTYDTSTLRLYLNGTLAAQTTATLTSSTGDMLIGRSKTGQYWNGKIDNVRIYNRALTADEIADMYRQGR
jgi:hypothetical protein